MEEADLVLYDALVSRGALDFATRAQRFQVGKRARRPSVSQDTIHALMIRAARRGKKVVRLKGGDPFVLGRGGEEALALAAAGVPFEVVPGVTSAVAAPALAGIPVTHRGLATGFAVVSGHAEAAWRPALASIQPGSLTLVVMMGLASRGLIARQLLAKGWPGATPAAVLMAASTPEAATWTGTLEGLAALRLAREPSDLPGTLVIGDVVSVAAEIARSAPSSVAEAPRASSVGR